MRNLFTHRNFYLLGLCTIAIALTLSPALMSIGQAILLINWIAEGGLNAKWNIVKTNLYLQAFLGIFLIHIIGLSYTTDFEYALKDIKIKLPLLILPLLIATSNSISLKELKTILYCLIAAVLTSSLYSLSIFLTIDNSKVDTLRNISPIISHIRFSLIICMGFYAIVYLIHTSTRKLSHWLNLLLIVIAIWFFIFIGILGARAGYLALMASASILFLYQIIIARKWTYIFILLFAVVAVPFLMYRFLPSVNQRIKEVKSEVNHYESGGNPSGHSITQRFEYWKIAKHIISENTIIGVGTGDIDDAFKNYYATHETPIKKEYQFRSHNQYLTIFCTFGIIGLAIFLFAFIFPYLYGIEKFALLPTVFIVMTLLSMLTEDTLETQAGATFVAFFFSILLLSSFKRKDTIVKS